MIKNVKQGIFRANCADTNGTPAEAQTGGCQEPSKHEGLRNNDFKSACKSSGNRFNARRYYAELAYDRSYCKVQEPFRLSDLEAVAADKQTLEILKGLVTWTDEK